jgi:hypothetical protein
MKAGGKQSSALTLVSCLAHSSTLKMEETCSSETSADFQRTTWHYISADRTLHNHCCENLKPTLPNKIGNKADHKYTAVEHVNHTRGKYQQCKHETIRTNNLHEPSN